MKTSTDISKTRQAVNAAFEVFAQEVVDFIKARGPSAFAVLAQQLGFDVSPASRQKVNRLVARGLLQSRLEPVAGQSRAAVVYELPEPETKFELPAAFFGPAQQERKQ